MNSRVLARQVYRRSRTPEQRLLAKLRHNGECLEFIGCRTPLGYGRISVGGETIYAHHLAYELAHGSIPNGHIIMHTCDNPSCCNAKHLVAGTHKENTHDSMRKGRWNTPRRIAARRAHQGANATRILDRADIEEIRNLKSDGYSCRQIAQRFGVGHNTIWRVVTKQSYREW